MSMLVVSGDTGREGLSRSRIPQDNTGSLQVRNT